MRFNQQFVRRRSGKPVLALMLGVATMLALAGRAWATVTVLDTFDNSESGSAPPASGLLLNPAPGSVAVTGTGGATVTTGAGVGSGNALEFLDSNPGSSVYLTYTPVVVDHDRLAHLSFDYLMESAGSGLTGGNVNFTLTASTSATYFYDFSVYNDGTFYIEANHVGGYPLGSYTHLSRNQAYHFDVEFDLSAKTATLTVTQGLSLIDTFGPFATPYYNSGLGFSKFELKDRSPFTAANDGSYIAIDNVMLEQVPEPNLLLLLGLGGGLLFRLHHGFGGQGLRRRNQRASAN